MKNTIFIPCLFLLTTTNNAQPNIEWQTSLGGSKSDVFRSVQQTSDGGFILAGDTGSNDGNISGNHGSLDAWVIKISNTGDVEWEKTIGGTGDDFGAAIQSTNDGGFILAGSSNSNDGDVSGNHGDYDCWIVKLSSGGDLQWQKSLGGSYWEVANDVKQTQDGGYIFIGETSSTDGDVSNNHGDRDYWVVKLTESGSLQWQKTFGGSMEDKGTSIQLTSDGGYILTGTAESFDGNVSDNHGSSDFWVIKLNSTGDLQWKKALGGSDSEFNPSIQPTMDGGYIMAGHTYSNNGDISLNHGLFDFWVVKLNALGTIQWQNSLGGDGIELFRGLQLTSDGGYLVTGSSSSDDGDLTQNHGLSDAWIVKLSNTGSINWQKSFGGSEKDVFQSIQQTTDGGFIGAGSSYSNDGDLSENQGLGDFWVVKLSPTVGINDPIAAANSALLDVFPNPSKGVVYLRENSGDSFMSVRIFDFMGQQISQQTLQSGGKMDVSALPNGAYQLVATTLLGQSFIGHLQIQK